MTPGDVFAWRPEGAGRRVPACETYEYYRLLSMNAASWDLDNAPTLVAFDVAIPEDHQGRNAADAITGRGGLVVTDVELGNAISLPAYSLGDVVEDRGDHLARPPIRPSNRREPVGRLQHFGFEKCRR